MERRKGDNCLLTQAEANKLYEGPDLDMANVFANAGNLLLTAFFFHPLLPLSIPIALVALTFSYWVNKYLLVWRVKRPDEMSGLMANFFANLLPWLALIWSLSLALFYRTIFTDLFKVGA